MSRNAILATGRLLSMVAESSGTAKPRWVVTFDDQPNWPDAEVPESDLGPISEKLDISSPAKKKKSSRRDFNEDSDLSRSSPILKAQSGKNSPISSESVDSDPPEDGPVEEERMADSSVGSKKSAAAISREERSKRRQAMIDEDKVTKNARPEKKKKIIKSSDDVVRVPLLTGTLYLYRGLQRRAEFVRKV